MFGDNKSVVDSSMTHNGKIHKRHVTFLREPGQVLEVRSDTVFFIFFCVFQFFYSMRDTTASINWDSS